ncbi:MAG: Methyltransferase type 12 [Labilithrix sp.]|nr:Methyltransferase type 12 [Labilithrix sp.]
MAAEVFDARYYDRFYKSARTRVHGKTEVARLCTAVTAMLDWWQVPVDSVLDVGAGVGMWRDWFKKHRPTVSYRSTEVSRYACAQYGHEQRDITRWKDRASFDLVVCQGVLPYIDDAGCAKAIDNLAAMTGGFLYLEAITKSDLREIIDQQKTDVKVHGRTGAWYRKRLGKHYVEVGCGLWAKRDAPVLFYELERR